MSLLLDIGCQFTILVAHFPSRLTTSLRLHGLDSVEVLGLASDEGSVEELFRCLFGSGLVDRDFDAFRNLCCVSAVFLRKRRRLTATAPTVVLSASGALGVETPAHPFVGSVPPGGTGVDTTWHTRFFRA